jgi:hypothetical protein
LLPNTAPARAIRRRCKAIDGINAAAEVRKINSLISIANGDSIASKYMIGEVPADAILDPGRAVTARDHRRDRLRHRLAYPNGGAMIVADCIVNGQTLASAAAVTLAAATGSGVATPTNMAKKKAWELAGLTANPGGNLALWLTFNAAATAAGTSGANICYSKGA